MRPNLTLRTMQLNAWVANNFMNIKILFYYNVITLKCLKTTLPFYLLLKLLYFVSITINGMRGRSIILYLLICHFDLFFAQYNKPNKSKNLISTLFITFFFVKMEVCFYLEKKLVWPKPEQPDRFRSPCYI